MKVRFSGLIALGAAVLTGVLVFAWSRSSVNDPLEGRDGRRVDGSREASTNGAVLTPRADALMKLEEELSRTFKPLGTRDSLEGVATPTYRAPQRYVISNQRGRDDTDRKNNWATMSPEEIAGLEEAAKLFDSTDLGAGSRNTRKPGGPDELFDNLGRPRSSLSGMNPGADENSPFANPYMPKPAAGAKEEEEDANLPQAVKESRKQLSDLLNPRSENNFFAGSTVESRVLDWYTPSESKSFLSERDSRKVYMEQYRQLLNGSAPGAAPTPNPWASTAFGSPAVTPQPGGNLMAPSGGSSLSARVNTVNPTLTPRAPEDVTARAVNQWNPLYVAPRVEPPKPTAPPKPNFDFPRRAF